MIEGKTTRGFNFKIDESNLDDYEVFENLCEIEKGKMGTMPDTMKKILGEKQYDNLKKFVRNKNNGKIPASVMMEELEEIMSANNQTKN